MSGVGGVLALVVLAFACADSSDEGAPREDAGETPTLPATDGGADATVPDDGGVEVRPDRICTDDQWCHTAVPTSSLVDAWGDDEGTVWAVDVMGGIYRWKESAWSLHHTSTTQWNTIWGSSRTELWAGGAAGLFRGDGAAWEAVPLGDEGETIEIKDIVGSAGAGVWAVGKNDLNQPRAFHRAAGATKWASIAIEAVATHEQGPFFVAFPRIWIAGNGDLWLDAAIRRRQGWSEVYADYLFRLPAGASVWEAVPLPATLADPLNYNRTLTGLGSVGGDVWLLGSTSRAGATYWVGRSDGITSDTDWKFARWKHPLDGSADEMLRFGVWGTSASDIWVAGSYSQIHHWDGSAWRLQRISLDSGPIGDTLFSLFGRSNEDLWAVGGGRAYHRVSKQEAARLDAEHAGKDGGT